MDFDLRHWIALSIIYTLYILFGATVFYQIEKPIEIDQRLNGLGARREVHGKRRGGY